MNSIWKESAHRPSFPPLQGDARTDVLIIGGGMAGILCAHCLKKAGVDCILVEAKEICNGTTGNTTAKITLQHGLIYHRLIRSVGEEGARLYYDAQKWAGKEYARLCQVFDCDYQTKDSYVYSIHDRKKIENEAVALNRLGEKAELWEELPLPFSVAGAVRVREQAQLHPLKFAFALAKGLPIYENTKVMKLMPNGAITQFGGIIRSKKTVIATHFPIWNRYGGYFLKQYQHRSYVLALEGAPDFEGMYADENEKGLSFRNAGQYLLLGGGAHRTGKQGGNWRELEAFANRYFPAARMVNKWATQDCMTLDGIPYIGQYSRQLPDVYVATGFHKWGMTSSMVSARLLTDLVQNRKNPWAALFSPSRSMLHWSLVVNGFESILGLLTPTAPRCPHLGCALQYNPAEHSWDCPCHGSRFSEQGEWLESPAIGDMKKR